jgi:hypothetical protein
MVERRSPVFWGVFREGQFASSAKVWSGASILNCNGGFVRDSLFFCYLIDFLE